MRGANHGIAQVVEHVGDVYLQALAVEGVAATFVDAFALGVHDVVVVQQAFADAEVVFFNFLLGAFDGLGYQAVLNHLPFHVAHAVHQARDAVRSEQAHEVVFQGNEELRAAWIALTAGAAAQLAVHSARVVALGADDGQSSGRLGFRCQFDVCSASGHVGGDGYGPGAASFRHNFSFPLVQLGVQYVVRDVPQLERAAQQLTDFNGRGSYQDWTAGVAQFNDFVDGRVVLFALGFVHQIIVIRTRDGSVRWDDGDVQLVDLPEFARFGFCGTGHARQFAVHAEVVLQGNRGVGLGGGLNGDVFFGLYGLVQPVGIPAAFHDAAGLLVHNLDFAVHQNVLLVLFKQGVRLQELAHGVHALAFDAVFAEQGGLVVGFVCGGFLGFFYGCQRRGDVGHHKEVRIGPLGQAFHAAVRELNLVVFLLNGEVKLFVDHLHFPAVVLQVEILGLLQQSLVPVFAEELDEGFVFGKAAVGAE